MHRRQGGGQRAGSGYNGGAQQQRQPQPDDPFASFWGAYGGNPYGNAATVVMAAPDMGRLSRTIPSRCARQRTISTRAIMPRRSTRWAACPPESETLAGIFSARWRRAACIIMRRQWNMRGRPQAMEPGNMQYQQLLSQLQGGGSWYSQQGQEYGRRTGGMNSVCTTFMLLNLCCACCGGGRMMYAPLFCCI